MAAACGLTRRRLKLMLKKPCFGRRPALSQLVAVIVAVEGNDLSSWFGSPERQPCAGALSAGWVAHARRFGPAPSAQSFSAPRGDEKLAEPIISRPSGQRTSAREPIGWLQAGAIRICRSAFLAWPVLAWLGRRRRRARMRLPELTSRALFANLLKLAAAAAKTPPSCWRRRRRLR